METSKHTVTLPIADYNELLQLKREHSYMSTTIKDITMLCHECISIKNSHDGFKRIIDMCENSKEPF